MTLTCTPPTIYRLIQGGPQNCWTANPIHGRQRIYLSGHLKPCACETKYKAVRDHPGGFDLWSNQTLQRSPTTPITSRALAQIKHWLVQPPDVAEDELLICDPPNWIEIARITTLDAALAIIFNIREKRGKLSSDVTIDPSGFAIVRLLLALGGACMVDQREKGGKQYVKVFSSEPSSGILLRRILCGVSDGEVAKALGDPLDYRAFVTGTRKGSQRDKIDLADVMLVALSGYGDKTPRTLGFRSHFDFQELIERAFERHWEHQIKASTQDVGA